MGWWRGRKTDVECGEGGGGGEEKTDTEDGEGGETDRR